jgi:hypothetical protein
VQCRVVPVSNSTLPQPEEDEHIQEVHSTEDKDDSANLKAQYFHKLASGHSSLPYL